MEESGNLHAPAALSPKKLTPRAHWTGGWVGPRAGLDTVAKRSITSTSRESNRITTLTELPRLHNS